jgi:hypothetical protein
MSIILDALRRERGQQTPGRSPNAAQTDAVLHTLGYGHLKPNTPLNLLKRVLGYLALAVVLMMALWFVVVWLTHEF